MRTHLVALSVALLALSSVACDDTDSGGSGDNNANNDTNNNASNNAPAGEASFATFNVGLPRGFVPYAADRVGPVGEALASYDADVLCLQEVWLVQDDEDNWTETDIDSIKAATASQYPHTHVHLTRSEAAAAGGCTEEEVVPLEACVQAACGELPLDELSNCVLTNCQDEFFATSSTCQSCAASQLGNPLEEIIDTCTSGGGDLFSYGGHNGLMLLSRYPFVATGEVEFESAITYRSALHGKVDIPDFGEVDVYCTHLASDLSNRIDYPGTENFATFEEENAGQIDGLLAFVNSSSTTDRHVIMGDFNAGPAVGSFSGELADNYATFITAGYTSAFAELDPPQCTYCDDENTITEGEGAIVIDHVFIDFDADASASRIFDETTTVSTEAEGDIDIHLSDHFGVRLDVK